MNANELSTVENCVFILSCCVDDLSGIVLALVANDFGKGVLDGRVVSIDEVTVDELNGKGALACA